ncbi:hotdog domain-containing protein [Streptomyces sp. LX-29]|uniref:3-hydroxyacyl-ACP dehydratase FabZ family protein n=1 Tax=Streptomyces sp. LX-29 TaxID=2900152 RepID=UPI00321BFC5B
MPTLSSVTPVDGTPEILESGAGDGARARTRVTVTEDSEKVFVGHYPGFPIFPGVCIVEYVHRSALATFPEPGEAWSLAAVESTRFLSPVFPGDTLTTEITWTRRGDGWRCQAVAGTERGPSAKVRLRYATEPAAWTGEPPVSPPAAETAAAPLTTEAIKRILPHRYPMLLVDRVEALVPGERLTAVKSVSCNEPWYQALPDKAAATDYHYPETLLVESWCQSAGVLVAHDTPNPDVLAGQVMLFGAISDVAYLRPVRPGDVVEHRVRLVRALRDTMFVEGESLVAGEPVMRVGSVVMAMRPAEELTGRPTA